MTSHHGTMLDAWSNCSGIEPLPAVRSSPTDFRRRPLRSGERQATAGCLECRQAFVTELAVFVVVIPADVD